MSPALIAAPDAAISAVLGAVVTAFLCAGVPAALRVLPARYRVPDASVLGCVGIGAFAGGLVAAALAGRVEVVVLPALVPLGVLLGYVDLRHHLLPRVLVLVATGVLLALALGAALVTGEYDDLARGLLGLLAARTLFWLLWRARPAGLGFGDVRVAALLGLVLGHLGWAELLVGIYAGFALLAVPGAVLALARRDLALLRTAYPFGPFLFAGASVGVTLGPWLAGLATG